MFPNRIIKLEKTREELVTKIKTFVDKYIGQVNENATIDSQEIREDQDTPIDEILSGNLEYLNIFDNKSKLKKDL